jgi:EAL domain-containing protein (putative c-di-GMP-specific phosphodiesterase class I)
MLVGTDRTDLRPMIDQCCLQAAGTLDVRTDVLWIEIDDAPALCRQLIQQISQRADQADVRLAWARPDATIDQLMHAAIASCTLADVADTLDDDALLADPPLFEVRYQPIIRLDDHTVVGFESLLRATHGTTNLDAEALIARAARSGWLNEFDQLGRSLAIGGIGPWLGEGLLFLNVMVIDGSFDVASISALVEKAIERGLDPDQIVLETSERNRYDSLDAAADQIAELRALGVRIAVDDVGDGYSSLAVVAAFEPDVVKIGGPIISRLANPTARSVVDAIVALAHDSGAWVIGENIEHRSQADVLRAAGVDWGQGNFLGIPETPA